MRKAFIFAAGIVAVSATFSIVMGADESESKHSIKAVMKAANCSVCHKAHRPPQQ